MVRTILASISHLDHFPELGRPGRVAGTRELVVRGSPYLAVYELYGPDVAILRVLHGAQLWPPGTEL